MLDRLVFTGAQNPIIIGHVDADQDVVVIARTAGQADVRSTSQSVTAAATGGFFRHTFTELLPETAYTYHVEVDTVEDGDSVGGTTAPIVGKFGSFSYALGSCFTDAASATFDRINARAIAYLLLMGDALYTDIMTDDIGAQRTRYLDLYGGNKIGRALAAFMTWDDHDYAGGDDSDASAVGRPAALQAWGEAALAPPSEVEGTIAHHFRWNRQRTIMLDSRAARTGSSILGAAQLTWFREQVIAARDAHEYLCINFVVPPLKTASDGWSSPSLLPHLRAVLQILLDEDMVTATYAVAGDMHALAADDGTGLEAVLAGAGIPVLQAAPIDAGASTAPGTYSEGTPYTGSGEQYGVVDITDTGGSTISVTFTGYSGAGETVGVSLSFQLSGDHLIRGRRRLAHMSRFSDTQRVAHTLGPVAVSEGGGGGGEEGNPAPLLYMRDIPNTSSNVDITGMADDVEAVFVQYSTPDGATPELQGSFGWGFWTYRDSGKQGYIAAGSEDGVAGRSRLSGDKIVGIQTSGIGSVPYTNTPDVYATMSQISGGIRFAFTVAGSPVGQNLGGKMLITVFPRREGVTDAQLLEGTTNVSPIVDAVTAATLQFTADGAFVVSHNAEDDQSGIQPMSFGVAAPSGSASMCWKSNNGTVGSTGGTTYFCRQTTDPAGGFQWGLSSLNMTTGAFSIAGGGQADRMFCLFVKGYEINVSQQAKISSGSGDTQTAPSAGFTPSVLLTMCSGEANEASIANKAKFSFGASDGANNYCSTHVQETTNTWHRQAWYDDRCIVLDDVSSGTYTAGPGCVAGALADETPLDWGSVSPANDTQTPATFFVALGAKVA